MAGMAAEVSGDAAVNVVAHFQSELLSMMRDADGLRLKGRFEKLEPEVKQSHDLPDIARLTIGRYWRSLDKQQQGRFIDTFTRLVVATYAHQFDSYNGETFKRKSARSLKRGRFLVRTELVKSNGKSVHLDYVLHFRKGRWSIINIIADGVSDLALKRVEYSHVLARDGFNVLISMLERKIAQYQ
ncbi:MAG: ABC transporter substrate-binding protein [Mariprofundus sp.]|nr:ABC transporter substrate-binding protein [Mariprofundus sp.]